MTTAADIGAAGVPTVTSLFQTSRTKRENAIKGLDLEFQDFKETSLIDESYTKSDVQTLFANYMNILKVSLNKQYQDFACGFADLAVQILEQTDGKQVQLSLDTSRFTGALFEDEMTKLEHELTNKAHGGLLPAVATRGVDPRKRLIDINSESSRLQKKAAAIQQQFNAMMKEKTSVQNELNAQLDILRAVKEVGTTPSEAALQTLRDELNRIGKETDQAQAEASGKINESTQFQNLKTIIQRKNEEIKALRERLAKFENVTNDDDDEED
eukprot:TRINITY_DN6410_c0_g1_i2.p1 TRINITY_DN6410_c0_g1~~TRINITY_DN6410_c0_g1_i2.p1  ORF type:complete len:270 (+),score=95.38 TRINITY_DN6410_c0_g1_i2:474-1283(+)